MSSFTEAVFAERALLAWDDPDGEAEAILPVDQGEAVQTIFRYLEMHKPKPARLTSDRPRWDNEAVLVALGARLDRTSGKVRCPAHEDRSPSLTWRVNRDRLLLRCWAGCTWDEILEAVS